MQQTPSDMGALYQPLRRAAQRIAPDRAEDLVQDTYLAVLRRRAAGGEIDNLPSYCRRTLRNLARATHNPGVAKDPDQIPAPRRATLELREVLAAIVSLPPPQRQLLYFCLAGDSYAEMAKKTGLPPGTVMSRLSRARAALRQRLALPAGRAVEALLAP